MIVIQKNNTIKNYVKRKKNQEQSTEKKIMNGYLNFDKKYVIFP